MKIYELTEKLDSLFPTSFMEEWDNDGDMLVLDKDREITGVVTALDVTDEAIDKAIGVGANVILSHHPFIFKPLKSLNSSPLSKRIEKLIKADISVISYHTRFDSAKGGMNDRLAKVLCLENPIPFGLKGGIAMGRIGEIEECSAEEFAQKVSKVLSTDVILYKGKERIRKVAVLGGGGKDFIHTAFTLGADAMVTGDISYSVMNEEIDYNITMIDAGHYGTEVIAVEIFAEILEEMKSFSVTRFYGRDRGEFIKKEI